MISATHLIVSLLLIQVMRLDRNDAFVALLFGVFIDLDHLIGLGSYTKSHGFRAAFDLHSLMNPGGQWKSMLHSPVAFAVVSPLSTASKLAIPLLFWGTHVAMDIIQTSYLGTLSSAEGLFLGLCACALVALRYSAYIQSPTKGTLTDYFGTELKNIRETFRFRRASMQF